MDELKPKTNIEYSTPKNFGIVFGIVFFVLGIWSYLHNITFSYFWFIFSLALILMSFLKPSVLKYPNLIWFKFGMILNSIISPIIMLLIYLITFIPTKLFFIISKKDPLNLKFNNKTNSYWIKRDSKIQPMDKQF